MDNLPIIMDPTDVSISIRLVAELIMTEFTFKRLVAPMSNFMNLQVGPLAESIPTNSTNIRFGRIMGAQMIDQFMGLKVDPTVLT